MKKIISLLLIVSLIFTLAGCGSSTTATGGTQELSTLTKIQENKKVVIGTAPGYFPFEMKDTDGNFIGYDIDIGYAIGESLGVEVEFKQYEFSGLIPALQTGDIDLILAGMTIRGDRAAAVSFSDPYFATGQVLMINGSDTTTKSWEDLDVEGKIIAASQGTTGALLAKQLFKSAEVVDYDTFPTSGMAISQGKADGIIYDEPPVRQFEIMNDNVKGIYDIISAENLGIATKLNDLEMVQWLNSFLYGYKSSPKDLESIDKWFNSTDWMEMIEE
ncbi:MAG TPA: transporter substrate-binding domain-containing protein [Tissierellaceae bacterium]|nr:transporter substrate-binding domain-containing protein [Tissierellaceae bacterium]